MCLLVVAWQVRDDAPLIVAANRDELHDRPSAPAAVWADDPGIVGGRDLVSGGTWLGVTRRGVFAAVTNVREPRVAVRPHAPSRGLLVSDLLQGRRTVAELEAAKHDYPGFNLLARSDGALYYLSNRVVGMQQLPPGIYGVSNGALDAPWPKVVRAKTELGRLLAAGPPDPDALLALLAERAVPPDAELPTTGVGREVERVLGPIFVTDPRYGTRASTVVVHTRAGAVDLVERRFDASGQVSGESRLSLAG